MENSNDYHGRKVKFSYPLLENFDDYYGVDFIFITPVLNLKTPEHQIIVAEQEKAIRKEEFELARHRLMQATTDLQYLRAQIKFKPK